MSVALWSGKRLLACWACGVLLECVVVAGIVAAVVFHASSGDVGPSAESGRTHAAVASLQLDTVPLAKRDSVLRAYYVEQGATRSYAVAVPPNSDSSFFTYLLLALVSLMAVPTMLVFITLKWFRNRAARAQAASSSAT